MHKKLLKAALDSNLLNYIDHETPRVYFICGHADIEEVESYGVKVVAECIRVIMESSDRYRKEYFADLLRQHFGVE